ncbi:hypothetical protein FEM48_Zijuj12G0080300 [Ziziphus jujuba var. spinosa]|uniref:RRM domain-containing protein n=1 Tax=Ziziphus jujuba var. spinosa TaxID=714518 RepID=A0A978UC47_ZIZJJ|nr:hypothetical protein FEM48_Zijuj12G0080300 [Ziziphus jujuba var. spinosa]
MRGRSYGYSHSPPRGYSRRRRSPSPRTRYRSRGRDLPTSLLVRNLRHDCRPEDLRGPFGQFGPLKDIYLPRDYYTGVEDINEINQVIKSVQDYLNVHEDSKEVGFEYIEKKFVLKNFISILSLVTTREPRGFGFVQYVEPADAEDAKYHMDGQILLGRELTVVFAEENRKKPSEMRARERSRGHSYDRRQSYSRSPDYYSPSPRRRRYSRSISPRLRRYRDRSYSRSPYGYGSRSRSPSYSRSRSRSMDY